MDGWNVGSKINNTSGATPQKAFSLPIKFHHEIHGAIITRGFILASSLSQRPIKGFCFSGNYSTAIQSKFQCTPRRERREEKNTLKFHGSLARLVFPRLLSYASRKA